MLYLFKVLKKSNLLQCALLFLIIICGNAVAEDTLWQTDWYMGDGQISIDRNWNDAYWVSDSLNIVNHRICFVAANIDYSHTGWKLIKIAGRPPEFHAAFYPYDFNDDGKNDFPVILPDGLYICFAESDSFECHKVYNITPIFNDITFTYPCDWNNDGKTDILFTLNRRGIYVLYDDDDGNPLTWAFSTLRSMPGNYIGLDHEIIDFDGDGFLDIVTGMNNVNDLCIIYGPNCTSIENIYHEHSSIGHIGWRTIVTDLDDDSDLDIVTVSSPRYLHIFRNDGDSLTLYLRHNFIHSDGLAVGDFDLDGDLDVIVGQIETSEGFYLFRNLYTETGVFSFSDSSRLTTERGYYDAICMHDFDLDGLQDLASCDSKVGWFRCTGPFSFREYEICTGYDRRADFAYAFNTELACGDEDVDIAFSCREGYYFLDNQMIRRYSSYGFLESSVLHIPPEKYAKSFGWVDCLPDGFDIDYFVRLGNSVTACTTESWTRVPMSGIPLESIVDNRTEDFFQYRIEFRRTIGDSAESPRVDSIHLALEYRPNINITFAEETDCDDRNIVEICYEISGDSVPYDVQLHLSIDSGITWTFPFDSIWDCEGDLGDSIYPGEHCLFWELGYDIPGIEGYYPMRIIASTDEFDCVCSNIFDDPLRYNGTIPICLILGKIPGVLTDINTNITYKLGDTTRGLEWFPDTTDTNFSSYLRGHINFTHRYSWSDGHLYIYYNLCSPVMYDTLKMILRKDDDIKLWIDGKLIFEEHDHLGNIDSLEPPDTVIVTLDSCKSHSVLMWLYDDWTNCIISHWFEDLHGNPATWLRYSLEPDTGTHYIETVSDTTVYFGPLDSKPPRVSLDCPDTSVFVGEEINILWDVEDLFFCNDSGIIIVEYGSETDTYDVADGRFDWTIPTSIDCDTAMIIVELRDSFCNWGYDSCEINILRPGYISISFGDTIGKRCRPVVVPLTIDSADAFIGSIMINIEVDTTAAIPMNFTPVYSPMPCSTVLTGDGELWTLELFWPMRITVTPGILGYINFMINCPAKAGFFTIIDITSSIADYADVYWRDGSIIVDYKSESWLTTLHFRDISSPKRNAELTFGANYSASDSYDPLVDLLYLAPPPDGLRIWFDIDDPVFPAVSQLHRDVKDLMTENVWTVIIDDPAGTYVNWNSSTFTEGIYILNNTQDMRVDTWYMAEPFETLIISWDLPRLELDTIAIKSGWNMVSLPVFNPISKSNFVFRDILSGPFEYNIATSTFFFPEFVAPGHGYWVYYLTDKDVILVGNKVELVKRNFEKGWNLIGVPGKQYASSEIDFDGGTLISVYGYEPSTGMFFEPDTLIPGQSYWLLVDTTGVVEIPR